MPTAHAPAREPRVWFITGISRGLGKATAEAVLEEGDIVIGTTRSGTCDLPPHERLHVLRLDVTDRAQAFATLDAARALHGRIDVVLNNAGYGLLGAIEEASEAEARDVVEANFFGTLNVTQAALPALRERRRGHVVNVTSIAGLAPGAGSGLYAAAKFAVEGFSQSLAQEVRPLGIRVTLVEPGAFRTDFLTESSIRRTERTIPDYEETSGAALRAFEQMNGRQAGDPAKAARAIIAAVDADDPPLHLILGSDALRRTLTMLEAFTAEIGAWEHVTLSTDFHSTQPSRLPQTARA